MPTKRFFRRPVAWLAAFVAACVVGAPGELSAQPAANPADVPHPPESAAALAGAAITVPASDSRFVYEGRFDRTDPARPVVIWQASRIRFGFEGDTVTLRFGDLRGQVFFDAEVDHRTTVVALRGDSILPISGGRGALTPREETSAMPRAVGASRPQGSVTLRGFGAGRHDVVLFKRTEAIAGTVRFLGVELQAGMALRPGVVPHYAERMLFVGDSITVGACNEDGPADQWEDRATHNAACSWAAMTAAAFHADHRNISVSGMGISVGWFDEPAGSIWDRLYPTSRSPRADLSAWTPDLVFVNFGENDDSFTRAHHQPFPADFTPRYGALVRDIRRAFPRAEIVLLRGGMHGGATSAPLQLAWDNAVRELRASDPRVNAYVFQHWSKNHPRVADDRAMADELIAWLRRQP